MNTLLKRMGIIRILVPIVVLAALSACGQNVESAPLPVEETPATEEMVVEAPIAEEPTPAPTEPPPMPVYLIPAEPPEPEITLQDIDGSLRAYEQRVLSGDRVLDNLYERPFTPYEMEYLPDVDIQTASIAADDNFFYFSIQLNDLDPAENALTGSYGIEFDRGKKGRGDLLVWAGSLTAEWSFDGLTVYEDKNQDVGGLNPILANEDHAGDGYETPVNFSQEKAAYARLSPEEPATVQLAVSRTLLDGAEEFLWGAWADRGWQDPGRFDYNDFIGPGAAGSSILDSGYYPVKDLYGLDNTCRLPYGFNPVDDIRGMCLSKPVPEKGGGRAGCTLICPAGAIAGCTLYCP